MFSSWCSDFYIMLNFPGHTKMDLFILKNDEVRRAIRCNQVSFPAGVPVFPRQSRADIAWRVALLYFVRGWSLNAVAHRYRLSRERTGQILRSWRSLAIKSGYIQEIPQDPFGVPAPEVRGRQADGIEGAGKVEERRAEARRQSRSFGPTMS
jgi:hypothetical protein